MGGAIRFWLLRAILFRRRYAIAVLEKGAIGFEEEGDRSFRGRAIGLGLLGAILLRRRYANAVVGVRGRSL